MAFTTVARRAEARETIRGSRFLAQVARADDEAAARSLLDAARRAHPDASHHVSAWRVGEILAAHDDGEPGGTAGRPILEVLLKRDLDHVAAVCVRWFGGTKLGAGGLVRAYGGTVAKALDAAGTAVVHASVEGRVTAPYARADAVHRLLDDWPDLRKGAPRYDAVGLSLPVTLRADRRERLARALADATAGDAELVVDAGEMNEP
ncbi:MAG: hypothetical protein GVY27_09455 [Deinococcus-Thermus bacterium]|nr:hypothetical protein [Deinococcota bacterium]